MENTRKDKLETIEKKLESEKAKEEIKNELKKAREWKLAQLSKYTNFKSDVDIEKMFSDERIQHQNNILDRIEEISDGPYVPKENIDAETDKTMTLEELIRRSIEFKIPQPENQVAIGDTETSLTPPSTFDEIATELINLHRKKNSDYGNAADKSYEKFGLISYIVRLGDKMNRLESLTKPGAEQKVNDESITDTLMDLAAYSIMAIESINKHGLK